MALIYKLSDVGEMKLLERADGTKVIEFVYRYVRVHIVLDNEKMKETLARYAGFVERQVDVPVRLPRFSKRQ